MIEDELTAPEASTSPRPEATDIAEALWRDIPEPLCRAMRARGFREPTAVQAAVAREAGGDRDLAISSQTGSGKTVALGLAMLPTLVAWSEARERPTPAVLVLVPTRELAMQVASELGWLLADLRRVSVCCVTGGSSLFRERHDLARQPAVVVGTPGRLLDHIRRGSIDGSAVACAVLDEADRMLDMGFREELEAILEATPPTRRTHLVSATFPEGIHALARRFQRDAVRVEGTRAGEANADIDHVIHVVDGNSRYDALINLLLLAGSERTLVFVPTRAETGQLAERLTEDGFAAGAISGELEQSQRTRTLTAFRNGSCRVLVATDVAARGLDIPEVATVVHTTLPLDIEGYTHRSGRTGRAGARGRSVVLLDVRARRRMQRLLSRAGIEASWDPVPDAAEVAAVLEKREHERLAAALAQAPDPSRVQLNEAEAMLAEAEPVDLVARLIGLLQRRSTTRPRSVRAVAPEPPVREDRGGAPRPGPGPAVGARTRARHEPGAAMVRFHVNWGHQGGATPQRLVALLCRRGRINSRALGSIDVGPFFSTFDVARSSAESFEEAAARPDARDPRIRIRRWKPKSPRHDGPGEDRPRPKRSTGVFKSTKTRL